MCSFIEWRRRSGTLRFRLSGESEIYSFLEGVVCLNNIVTHASAGGKNGARLRTVAQRPPDTIPIFTPCLKCKSSHKRSVSLYNVYTRTQDGQAGKLVSEVREGKTYMSSPICSRR